jgi:DNA primase
VAPQFPRELVREVAESTAMVELVRRHVPLKRRGSTWTGLCPFHNEKSPSFYVNEARKTFKCFGCDEGGDAIAFLMKIEGLNFVDAVKELADMAGIVLPKEELTPQQAEALSYRDKLYKANEVAAKFFASVLKTDEGKEGREELERREIGAELIDKFRIGVAPDSWDALLGALRKANINPRVGEDAGLLVPNKKGSWYDRFRNRLIFPITAPGGRVVAFGGRTLGDDSAKYINSPESPVYNKSATLYGLHEARGPIHKADRVLVVEGYFDVVGLYGAGLGYAVAPCGTALTDKQLGALRRHTRNVVMTFDGDTAGQRASMKALRLCLAADLWPSQLLLPDGMDPDDVVRKKGASVMQDLVANSVTPLMDRFLDQMLGDAGGDMRSREAALEEITPVLAMLPGSARKQYIDRASLSLGMSVDHLDGSVRNVRRQPRPPAREPEGSPHGPPDGFAEAGPRRRKPSNPEVLLLRVMVQDLTNVAPVVEDLGAVSWLRHPEVERVVGRMMACWREARELRGADLLYDVEDATIRSAISGDLTTDERWFTPEVRARSVDEAMIRLAVGWIDREIRLLARRIDELSRQPDVDLQTLQDLSSKRIEFERHRRDWQKELPEALSKVVVVDEPQAADPESDSIS